MRAALLTIAALALLFAAACKGEPTPGPPATVTPEALPEQGTVSGTVTYAEKIPLTPGATLEVRLNEFYRLDGVPSPNITSRTITNPGQVPIPYEIEYIPHNDPSRSYSVTALIVEADGRLAFHGGRGFEGNSPGGIAQVDIHMSLVEPPPELAAQLDRDWKTLRSVKVETPAPIIGVRYDLHRPDSPEHRLVVGFHRSAVPNCEGYWYPHGGPESNTLPRVDIYPPLKDHRWAVAVRGTEINVKIMLWEPPPLPWDNGCGEKLQEVWLTLPIPGELQSGEMYTVRANGVVVSAFTLPSKI